MGQSCPKCPEPEQITCPTCPPDREKLLDTYRYMMLGMEGGMIKDRWDGGSANQERELALLRISNTDFLQAQGNLQQAMLAKHSDFANESEVMNMFFGDLGDTLRAHTSLPEQFQVPRLPVGLSWFDVIVIVLVVYLLMSKKT